MENLNNDQKIIEDIQDYFQKHKYVVIRKFLDENMAGLLYQYCITKVKAMDFKYLWANNEYNKEWDGQFGDEQAPISFSAYGDTMMDTLLTASTPTIEKYVGLELFPNYTYWRFYQKGEVLKRHSDRASCEISTTLCLGYNTANLNEDVRKDYAWPMYIESSAHPDVDGVPVSLYPGDMIIYKGCDLEHWRDPFIGLNHAQVFMHYNDKNGPYRNRLDGRPIAGVPKKFQV
jgi:hypothetical protein